jgi:hypothetical protein
MIMVRRPRTRCSAAALAAVALLAFPAQAGAHLRAGTVAVDYRATVLHARTAAYVARIYQSDRGLTLTIRPGHSVTLVGFLGEPVFRLDPAGLWINQASPTAIVAGLLPKHARLAASRVSWRLRPRRTSVSWHDARAQGLPQGIAHGRWMVPLTIDGHPAALAGELTRLPAPSLPVWAGILAVVLAAGIAPVLRRRDLLPVVVVDLAGVAGTAAAGAALVFALDAYASPGTWIEAADAIAFLAVGFGVLVRGPAHAHVLAAIGVGLVSLAVGLLDGAVFFHPIVLAVVPGWCARMLCVVAIGAGVGAAGLGCASYAGTLAAALEGDAGLDSTPVRRS